MCEMEKKHHQFCHFSAADMGISVERPPQQPIISYPFYIIGDKMTAGSGEKTLGIPDVV